MSEGIDYVVMKYPMPGTVSGILFKRACDDMPIIIINDNLSDQKKYDALNHELRHLEHDDLYNEEIPVYEIERRCNEP